MTWDEELPDADTFTEKKFSIFLAQVERARAQPDECGKSFAAVIKFGPRWGLLVWHCIFAANGTPLIRSWGDSFIHRSLQLLGSYGLA